MEGWSDVYIHTHTDIYIYIHIYTHTDIYIYRFIERDMERGINNIDDRMMARTSSHAFVHAHINI